jgi:hypothetical protein
LEHAPELLEYAPELLEHAPELLEYAPRLLEHAPGVRKSRRRIYEIDRMFRMQGRPVGRRPGSSVVGRHPPVSSRVCPPPSFVFFSYLCIHMKQLFYTV